MAQAYREDKTTAFMVEDSAVLLSAANCGGEIRGGLGHRMAKGGTRGGEGRRAVHDAIPVVRGGFGWGRDDVNLEQLGDDSLSDSGESAFRRDGWQEMDGGISVHSYSSHANSDEVEASFE